MSDLYPHQRQIIQALYDGKSIIRFGSRRVGLSTAGYWYINRMLISYDNWLALVIRRSEYKHAAQVVASPRVTTLSMNELPGFLQENEIIFDFIFFDGVTIDIPEWSIHAGQMEFPDKNKEFSSYKELIGAALETLKPKGVWAYLSTTPTWYDDKFAKEMQGKGLCKYEPSAQWNIVGKST